jgi:hypothetical protein
MADNVGNLLSNPLYIIGIIVVVAVFILWQFRKGNIKKISRAELLRKNTIQILKRNAKIYAVLKQKNNIIGIVTRMNYYEPNEKEKLYLILYNPAWFQTIPQFWNEQPMFISGKYFIPNGDMLFHKEKLGFMKFGKNLVNTLILQDNYVLDMFENHILKLTDTNAVEFVKTKIAFDEYEIGSSVTLAQQIRLTNVNPDKEYSGNATPSYIERSEKEVQKA